MTKIYISILFSVFISAASLRAQVQLYTDITCGAQRMDQYLPKLKNKRVAIVTNASGVVGNRHLVDTLLKQHVKIVKIFGPEHGFRGGSDAGVKVNSSKDSKTGLPVVSLYGNHKKPTKEDLKGVDIVLYDIQDVGVRFYTYISTMSYVMEACAENHVEMLILDRPNPNGYYIDGPVMTPDYKSFLGMHPVPIVYGMTCGEYARMVNGEGWLKNGVQCQLSVITLLNYDRNSFVSGLPVKPSPNLPNDTAILLYPSLGLFEGTIVSLGRGTDCPFQYIGSPYTDPGLSFAFTPKANAVSKKPKYMDTACYGINLKPQFTITLRSHAINLQWLKYFYEHSSKKQDEFFDKNFNYHVGNNILKQQIIDHVSEEDIRASWKKEIDAFRAIRQKYLLYN
ncbi:MAG: DUF1343 domain-containing protein [Bacteroidetes bacterium]|nr:DUF1343 domain-containing protein [Bacteroidota bacterium]